MTHHFPPPDTLVISSNLGPHYVVPCIIYYIRILSIIHGSKLVHGVSVCKISSVYTRVPVSGEVLQDLASLPSLTINIPEINSSKIIFIFVWLINVY